MRGVVDGAEAIVTWSAEFRQQSNGEFQINLWIPGPAPVRDDELERQQREYLATWRSNLQFGPHRWSGSR